MRRQKASYRVVIFSLSLSLYTGYSFLTPNLYAQVPTSGVTTSELKKLTIEQLMKVEVTSVSKRPEKLTEVASAIQVITNDDIYRSAATNIPEALKLAPNLQVSQLTSYAWIIGARGFNALFSNKFLVMIDGRTVYSPLFAGVFWDAQQMLLEDIGRIEVVSGPGGTMWGANAVNGVINIISKDSKETQGLYATAATGSFLKDHAAFRYGGTLGKDLTYRVYVQHFDRDNLVHPDGSDNADKWGLTQSGFRMDWNPSDENSFMFQGAFYNGREETNPSPATFDGQNIMARWNHTSSENSNLMLQFYFDRTWRRDPPSTISDELKTYDIDFNHRFLLGSHNTVLWGLGYRLMQDEAIHGTPFVGFLPPKRNLQLFSGFVQDEIGVIPEKVKLTLGAKLLHNDYTQFEWQPSMRVAWTPTDRHTVWGAVSRAVRTPSRIDADYYLPTYYVPPDQPSVQGGPSFESEKLVAYELGYRVRTASRFSASLALFYNRYDDVYSVEALPGTLTYQIQNGTLAEGRGAEVSGGVQMLQAWQVRGGYTYIKNELRNKPGHVYDFGPIANDAENQLFLQSKLDLTSYFQVDVTAKYVDRLRTVADYFTFDVRAAALYKGLELSVVGQNLWDDLHPEFGPLQTPRSFYVRLTCRLSK